MLIASISSSSKRKREAFTFQDWLALSTLGELNFELEMRKKSRIIRIYNRERERERERVGNSKNRFRGGNEPENHSRNFQYFNNKKINKYSGI